MKKTIYFLPGTMCDQRMWLFAEPFILKDKSIELSIVHLTIGHQISIDALVEDIARQLPDSTVDLLGFSLGGYLATAFAVKYPERIANLFVVSNMPCALPEREIKERKRTIDWLSSHGYSGIPIKRIQNLLDESAWQKRELFDLIGKMDADFGGGVLQQQLNATTQRENLFHQLPELDCNKYFCVGKNDNLADACAIQAAAKYDKRMQVSVFEQTGHMLPLEKPEAFAQWLLEIIKKH